MLGIRIIQHSFYFRKGIFTFEVRCTSPGDPALNETTKAEAVLVLRREEVGNQIWC
jgi:hypothetical protein